jgi:hypothetical protein
VEGEPSPLPEQSAEQVVQQFAEQIADRPIPSVYHDLAVVSGQARSRERKSYVFLVILVVVAVGAVAAGMIVDNTVFWATAGSVFFMACAGIVVYAAEGLGLTAQLLDMIQGHVLSRASVPAPRRSHGGESDEERILREFRDFLASVRLPGDFAPTEPTAED